MWPMNLWIQPDLTTENPETCTSHGLWGKGKGRSSPQQKHGLWFTYSFPYNVGKPIINHPSNHHICGINNSHMGCLLFIVVTSFNHIITQSYDHCALIGLYLQLYLGVVMLVGVMCDYWGWNLCTCLMKLTHVSSRLTNPVSLVLEVPHQIVRIWWLKYHIPLTWKYLKFSHLGMIPNDVTSYASMTSQWSHY